MLDHLNELAEQVASSASRRHFLGRAGASAMKLAALVGGLLALPASARPAPKACGLSSDQYCRGLVEGAYCQIGTMPGTCVGSPACYCRPARPRRR